MSKTPALNNSIDKKDVAESSPPASTEVTVPINKVTDKIEKIGEIEEASSDGSGSAFERTEEVRE